MYEKKRIIGFIPARGGSKGIKDKNIIDLCGKPLISYTITASLDSNYIDKTIVSTDSNIIADISRECGADVPFMRPIELASDTSKTIDVVMHFLKYLESNKEKYDALVLLQPTQPLRTNTDIDKSIELFFQKQQRGLASVSPVDDHPILIRTINADCEMSSLLEMGSTCRRQDMPEYFRVNGCIYVNKVEDITDKTSFNDNPVGYVMESTHSVDIDELKDLALAEYYLKRGTKA